MADWTNIVDTALDPDAPVTSELAYAWRDNPIAIAEGAPGAPAVSFTAMKSHGGWVVGNNNDPATIIGLGGLDFFTAFVTFKSGANTRQISATADNGASWTGWATFPNTMGFIFFDRASGSILLNTSAADATGVISGVSGLNGVRVRITDALTGVNSRIGLIDACGGKSA